MTRSPTARLSLVTDPVPMQVPDHLDLDLGDPAVARLLKVVRPEFRTNPILAPKGHPLLSMGPCQIYGCARDTADNPKACRAHYITWLTGPCRRGVTLQQWIESNPGPVKTDVFVASCRVEGCMFGRQTHGFCTRHARTWIKRGRPDPDEHAALCSPRYRASQRRKQCLIGTCELLVEGYTPFCIAHRTRYDTMRRRGREMTAEQFSSYVTNYSIPKVRLDGLPPQLTLEIQYVIQAYFDRGSHKTRMDAWQKWIGVIAADGARSLLDHSLHYWLQLARRVRRSDAYAGRMFRWAWDEVDQVINGTGWDAEYSRDVWRLDRVGVDRNESCRTLRFDRISQPWLEGLTRRWARHRLTTGRSASTVHAGLRALEHLSTYLERVDLAGAGPHRLNRAVLEGFLAELTLSTAQAKSRAGQVSQIRMFLRDVHQHDWAPTLPRSCVVYSDDAPRWSHGEFPGRALPEVVMQQIEQKLPTFGDLTTRLALEILMRCGLRSKGALWIAWDCLIRDGDGHPYLRYLNHKMKRTAFVPIDEELAERVRAQQQLVLRRFPDDPARLFPALRENPDGQRPFSGTTLRERFYEWLLAAGITDEHGRPAKVTMHQFRHTFGTRLINNDVPQHIVQQLLDHQSRR